MRYAAALLTLFLAAATAQPAMACQRNPGLGAAVLSREAYAAVLVDAAVDIDLAIAVRPDAIRIETWVDMAKGMSGFDDDDPMFGRQHRVDAAKDLVALGAARIAFRSVEKLKGGDPREFHLYGFWATGTVQPESDLFHKGLAVFELWPTGFSSGCTTDVYVYQDGLYLIFRDTQGRLLDAERLEGDPIPGKVWGRPFEQIDASDDPWLAAVRSAAAAH